MTKRPMILRGELPNSTTLILENGTKIIGVKNIKKYIGNSKPKITHVYFDEFKDIENRWCKDD